MAISHAEIFFLKLYHKKCLVYHGKCQFQHEQANIHQYRYIKINDRTSTFRQQTRGSAPERWVQLVWFASLIGLAVEIIGITRLGQPFRSFGIYNIFAPWVLRGMMSKTGWWFQPLWKMLFSWDDYSQYMEKEKLFQTTNQKIVLYPIWSWIETTNELFTFDIFWTRCRNRASWVSETQKQCQFTESLSI